MCFTLPVSIIKPNFIQSRSLEVNVTCRPDDECPAEHCCKSHERHTKKSGIVLFRAVRRVTAEPNGFVYPSNLKFIARPTVTGC